MGGGPGGGSLRKPGRQELFPSHSKQPTPFRQKATLTSNPSQGYCCMSNAQKDAINGFFHLLLK